MSELKQTSNFLRSIERFLQQSPPSRAHFRIPLWTWKSWPVNNNKTTPRTQVLPVNRELIPFDWNAPNSTSKRYFYWDSFQCVLKDSFMIQAHLQCDQIRPNFATLAKFYKSLAIFWRFFSYFAKCWAHFGEFGNIIGLIFIVANGQMLRNNLTIWSHCSHLRDEKSCK